MIVAAAVLWARDSRSRRDRRRGAGGDPRRPRLRLLADQLHRAAGRHRRGLRAALQRDLRRPSRPRPSWCWPSRRWSFLGGTSEAEDSAEEVSSGRSTLVEGGIDLFTAEPGRRARVGLVLGRLQRAGGPGPEPADDLPQRDRHRRGRAGRGRARRLRGGRRHGDHGPADRHARDRPRPRGAGVGDRRPAREPGSPAARPHRPGGRVRRDAGPHGRLRELPDRPDHLGDPRDRCGAGRDLRPHRTRRDRLPAPPGDDGRGIHGLQRPLEADRGRAAAALHALPLARRLRRGRGPDHRRDRHEHRHQARGDRGAAALLLPARRGPRPGRQDRASPPSSGRRPSGWRC